MRALRHAGFRSHISGLDSAASPSFMSSFSKLPAVGQILHLKSSEICFVASEASHSREGTNAWINTLDDAGLVEP